MSLSSSGQTNSFLQVTPRLQTGRPSIFDPDIYLDEYLDDNSSSFSPNPTKDAEGDYFSGVEDNKENINANNKKCPKNSSVEMFPDNASLGTSPKRSNPFEAHLSKSIKKFNSTDTVRSRLTFEKETPAAVQSLKPFSLSMVVVQSSGDEENLKAQILDFKKYIISHFMKKGKNERDKIRRDILRDVFFELHKSNPYLYVYGILSSKKLAPGEIPYVVLEGFSYEKIHYVKRKGEDYRHARNDFNSHSRGVFLKSLVDSSKKEENVKKQLKALYGHSFPQQTSQQIQDKVNESIKCLKQGKSPVGFDVHHRAPLGGGGSNDPRNLILIPSARYKSEEGHYRESHRAIHHRAQPHEILTRNMHGGEEISLFYPTPCTADTLFPNIPDKHSLHVVNSESEYRGLIKLLKGFERAQQLYREKMKKMRTEKQEHKTEKWDQEESFGIEALFS
jgi:hypothetical protein